MSASPPKLELASLHEAPIWQSWLSAEEKARADAMENPALRDRFIVSRGLRRKVLSECLRCAAAELAFHEGGGVKPRLEVAGGWDFNISHAGDFVALAVGQGAVGVDLERMRAVREIETLVARYFHPDEAAAWRMEPVERALEAFYVLWSAREAAMKYAGTGLARGLSLTRVDPEILATGEGEASVGPARCRLRRVKAPEGYVLIVAAISG